METGEAYNGGFLIINAVDLYWRGECLSRLGYMNLYTNQNKVKEYGKSDKILV